MLIKQIERLPDPTGPFWNEVYERILTDVNTKLEDTGGITKDGIEGFNLKMYLYILSLEVQKIL